LALTAALALVVAAVVLVLRSHIIQSRKELAMATTLDRPTTSTEMARSAQKRDRRLIWTVVALVVGLIALGTYVAFDEAASPETAAPANVAELYDDYVNSWVGPDTDRFLELTTDNYTFSSSGNVTTATVQASMISGVGGFTSVERIGDLIVTSDGSTFYVAVVERIVYGGTEYEGVSALRMVESASGLRVAHHSWVGNL